MLAQSLAIAIVYVGSPRVSSEFGNAPSLIEASAVTLLVAGALLLNMSALKTLGANFAIIARVREGGTLVTQGPYSFIRNPIYLCYFLLLIAAALAFGHPLNLLIAAPLYLVGTALRIAPEERLLGERFGAEYATYTARVKRLVPYIW
jgi:protein-S-isoprenylcysteine O-methyltransferase Ste14